MTHDNANREINISVIQKMGSDQKSIYSLVASEENIQKQPCIRICTYVQYVNK